MQEPGRRVGESLVASREGQCKGPEAQRGAGGAAAETAQVREERASSSGPWRSSPLSEMDGGGTLGGPGADGARDLISILQNLSATVWEIEGAGGELRGQLRGHCRGPSSRWGSLRAGAEMVRSGWILDLSEGREDVESEVKAEGRRSQW